MVRPAERNASRSIIDPMGLTLGVDFIRQSIRMAESVVDCVIGNGSIPIPASAFIVSHDSATATTSPDAESIRRRQSMVHSLVGFVVAVVPSPFGCMETNDERDNFGTRLVHFNIFHRRS